MIKLEQSSDGTEAIVSWDFNINNITRELYGLQKNPRVIHDYFGNPYVINNNLLTMVNVRSSFLCYDIKDYGPNFKLTQEAEFGIDRGHKFDYLNHNWLILG